MSNKGRETHNWKQYIGLISVIVVYFVLLFIVKTHVPQSKELFVLIENFYRTVGYEIVVLAALAESIFPIGLYIPGSTIILLGAALSRSGAVSFPIIMILAICTFMVGYCINYMVGKYGLSKTLKQIGFEQGLVEAEEKLLKHGWKAIIVGYISPATASFLSLAAGTLKYPFPNFIFFSFIAQTGWILLWGTLAYLLGYLFVELFLKYIYLVGVVVILFYVGKMIWTSKKTT